MEGYLDTKYGTLRVVLQGETVTRIEWQATEGDAAAVSSLGADPVEEALFRRVREELSAYFAGERRQFTFPTAPCGTPFRRRVWQALLRIPYGETCTYGQLAAFLGNPKAARAVGQACHHNPLALVIPCHRVVGTNGKAVGYRGGIDKKEALLALEQAVCHAEVCGKDPSSHAMSVEDIG